MPDPWSTITEAPTDFLSIWADLLESRADSQRASIEQYLAEVAFPDQARVLEVGCGTGAVTRVVAGVPQVADAIGIDPSPFFLAKARERGADIPNLRFLLGDGRTLPFDPASIDVVIFHATLCHVPEPDRFLREAHRVLRPNGMVAVFDGDYPTAGTAIADGDPLQAVIESFYFDRINDRYLMRRLPGFIRTLGFEPGPLRSHGLVQADFQAQALRAAIAWQESRGVIGAELADGLRAEIERRREIGFPGFIGYLSLIARKPA